MMVPIPPIGSGSHIFTAMPIAPPVTVQPTATSSFADIFAAGLKAVDSKVSHADAMVQAYAKGDPVPVHQVTLALEQARLAVELAVQVRTRLVETYREFMNMQL